MSEGISKDKASSGWFSRTLIILTLVALFVPYSLGFSITGSRNEMSYVYSLIAVCWTLVRQDSYVFSELQSSISFQFASSEALSQAMMILPLYIIVMYTQSRFMRGATSRNMALLVIVIALGIQLLIPNSIVMVDGWAAYGTYPFPIFYILNLVSVFWQREPKSTPLGSN